jgi:hypothetical protein
MAARSSEPSSATLPAEGDGAARPSASADASHAAEHARIRAMSPVERMKLALELGRLCAQVELKKPAR